MAAGPAPPRPRPADDATVDQLWSASGWDSVPLFMRSLPPSSSDPAPTSTADNGALEALQALVYESSPEETVRSLRERGNELFRSKRWKEAKGFYDQAIEEVMLKDGQQVEQETKRAVYSNRAACHYELGVLDPPVDATER